LEKKQEKQAIVDDQVIQVAALMFFDRKLNSEANMKRI